MPDTISLSPDMASLAEEIVANGINADEVMRLRREIFKDGVADREEARLLFYLNERAGPVNDASWYSFFVEGLGDYFVWKQQPVGYMSESDADFLIAEITRDGRIDGRTEFGLLVNIIHRLRVAPKRVVLLALEAVRDTVLGDGRVVFGPDDRRPGVIDKADVDIIRAVIYGTGGDGSLTISQREAELIFELNDRTAEKENAPEWQRLFVQAVANYLMFPSGAPAVPDRDEAMRRERWLDERRGTGRLLKETLGSINTQTFFSAAAEVFGFNRKAEAEAAAQRERIAQAEAFAREAISEEEADWLSEHIMRDGTLHDNERALLQFIRENSPMIHASLDPLFEKAGL